MNLYKVYYEYLDSTCDSPNVTVEGETEIEATTHHEAKKYVKNMHTLFFKRGFKIIKSKLLDKDIHKLERVKIGGKDCAVGISASFLFLEEEIVVTAKTVDKLESVAKTLFKRNLKLDVDLCRKTVTHKYGN